MTVLDTWRCALCPTTGLDQPGSSHVIGLHFDAVHNPRRERPNPTEWESAALALLRAAATSGRVFTVAEVLAPIGEHPEPDMRQSINGNLTRRVAAQGLIEHSGSQESVKETSNYSLVRRWVGTDQARRAA